LQFILRQSQPKDGNLLKDFFIIRGLCIQECHKWISSAISVQAVIFVLRPMRVSHFNQRVRTVWKLSDRDRHKK